MIKPGKLSRQRRWQLKKRTENKCTICGEPALDNKYFCEYHRAARAQRSRSAMAALRSARKALGLCVGCGKQKSYKGGYCLLHYQDMLVRAQERRDSNRKRKVDLGQGTVRVMEKTEHPSQETHQEITARLRLLKLCRENLERLQKIERALGRSVSNDPRLSSESNDSK